VKLNLIAAALAVSILAACGGGGGSSATPTAPVVVPSPVASAPVVAQSKLKIGAGFSGAGQKTVAAVRRALAKRVALANSVGVIEPVVQSFSTNANWGDNVSNLFVWAFDPTTGATVPEAGLTTTISLPGLTVQNDGMDSAPGGFEGITNDWSVAFNPPTATGQFPATITFADGTTGTVSLDVYDTFFVGCPGSTPTPPIADVYQNGAPIPSTTSNADISIDCSGGNLVFPNGGVIASAPVADVYGNVVTTISSVITPPGVPTTPLIVPLSSVSIGEVFVARTASGGFAKFEPDVAEGNIAALNVFNVSGFSLSTTASLPFAF
jgi:hypothetical protein